MSDEELLLEQDVAGDCQAIVTVRDAPVGSEFYWTEAGSVTTLAVHVVAPAQRKYVMDVSLLKTF